MTSAPLFPISSTHENQKKYIYEDRSLKVPLFVLQENKQIFQDYFYRVDDDLWDHKGEKIPLKDYIYEMQKSVQIFGGHSVIEYKQLWQQFKIDRNKYPFNQKTTIKVINENCIDVAIDLYNQTQTVPLLLNMAQRSIQTICGAWDKPRNSSQEETIERRSAVYRMGLDPQFNKYFHKKLSEITGTLPEHHVPEFGAVYNASVPILRDAQWRFYDKPFIVDIVACGGIDLKKNQIFKDGERARYFHNGYMPFNNPFNDELFSKHTRYKIRCILITALMTGHSDIVLGAIGCGSFQNPPDIIARCFKEVLDSPYFKNTFRTVLFAILGENSTSYQIFNKILTSEELNITRIDIKAPEQKKLNEPLPYLQEQLKLLPPEQLQILLQNVQPTNYPITPQNTLQAPQSQQIYPQNVQPTNYPITPQNTLQAPQQIYPQSTQKLPQTAGNSPQLQQNVPQTTAQLSEKPEPQFSSPKQTPSRAMRMETVQVRPSFRKEEKPASPDMNKVPLTRLSSTQGTLSNNSLTPKKPSMAATINISKPTIPMTEYLKTKYPPHYKKFKYLYFLVDSNGKHHILSVSLLNQLNHYKNHEKTPIVLPWNNSDYKFDLNSMKCEIVSNHPTTSLTIGLYPELIDWYFNNEDLTFQRYGENEMRQVEMGFVNQSKIVNLTIGKHQYIIDLDKNVQRNITTGTERKIISNLDIEKLRAFGKNLPKNLPNKTQAGIVPLQKTDLEYIRVSELFYLTVPRIAKSTFSFFNAKGNSVNTIIRIDKIFNPYRSNWEKELSMVSSQHIHIDCSQLLFYASSQNPSHIRNTEYGWTPNFPDYRPFGDLIYFSEDAITLLPYCFTITSTDTRIMYLAEVITGEYRVWDPMLPHERDFKGYDSMVGLVNNRWVWGIDQKIRAYPTYQIEFSPSG